MSSSKKCTNCGADNDPLFTNCIFCKSTLPETDMASITNEELVLKAGEWVGKARQPDYSIEKNDPDANYYTGKGVHIIQIKNADIVGNAEKYLSLIQVRAITNATLLPLHENLRKQLDENKAFALKHDPMKRIIKILLVSFAFILIIFVIIVIATR